MSNKLQSDGCYYYTQGETALLAPSGKCYEVKAGVVCLQVKLCDPHLSALEVRFSRYTNLRLPLPLPIKPTKAILVRTKVSLSPFVLL